MLPVDYKKNLRENRQFSWKIMILGNYRPFGALKEITIFEKLFDYFNAHIKQQSLQGLPYSGSNFKKITPP